MSIDVASQPTGIYMDALLGHAVGACMREREWRKLLEEEKKKET